MDLQKIRIKSLEKERIILRILNKNKKYDRSKLTEISGIPRSTVYDALIRLINKGMVLTCITQRKGRGRRKVLYQKVLD